MDSNPPRRRLAATLCGLLGALFCGLGCAPSLTSLGARVELAHAAPPEACRVIGEVDGDGGSAEAAQVRLRNAAGCLHANRVVVHETLTTGGRVRLHGQAFGCRPPLD